MTEIDKFEGSGGWRNSGNHNRLMEVQFFRPEYGEGLELTYFGHSAFRVTAPSGLTVLIDPWRNHPSGGGGGAFFFGDFPKLTVDIGVVTHAHFDHDAIHRLDASVIIERPVGHYQFADIKITGIADKHATDFSATDYDIGEILQRTQGTDIHPPNNPRSWDNCLVLIETGGLRLLHWGDNRPNADARVWPMLGSVDILILPIDDSQHVLSFSDVARVISQVQPKIVIPAHYYIPSITQRYSTLRTISNWLSDQTTHTKLHESSLFVKPDMQWKAGEVVCFGEHVASA